VSGYLVVASNGSSVCRWLDSYLPSFSKGGAGGGFLWVQTPSTSFDFVPDTETLEVSGYLMVASSGSWSVSGWIFNSLLRQRPDLELFEKRGRSWFSFGSDSFTVL